MASKTYAYQEIVSEYLEANARELVEGDQLDKDTSSASSHLGKFQSHLL